MSASDRLGKLASIAGWFAHFAGPSSLRLVGAIAFGIFLGAGLAPAATINVTTTADELVLNGACSLREAISAANGDVSVDTCASGSGADRIVLPGGLFSVTREGGAEDANATGDLDILGDVEIVGNGSVVRAANLDRVLHVQSGVVSISDLTLERGWESGWPFAGRGGGILNAGNLTLTRCRILSSHTQGGGIAIRAFGGGIFNSGVLTLDECEISDCSAIGTGGPSPGTGANGHGGGIANDGGTIVIRDSTIASNTAYGGSNGGAALGGGIYNDSSSPMAVPSVTILCSTISGNAATANYPSPGAGSGGGIATFSGSVSISSSTVAGNSASSQGGNVRTTVPFSAKSTIFADGSSTSEPDFFGTVSSYGYNLIESTSGTTIVDVAGAGTNVLGVDPALAPLGGNGGATKTRALAPASAAVGKGAGTDISGISIPEDQRGLRRIVGAAADVGAYELQLDFGDADFPFPTLLSSGGARHVASGPYLGSRRDGEPDGQPHASAAGDDSDWSDDEDGVSAPRCLEPGLTAEVDVTASEIGSLSGWVDFDGNGDWAGAGEQIFSAVPVSAGANTLTFAVPLAAVPGVRFARFRLVASGSVGAAGIALNGEVEDHLWTLGALCSSPPDASPSNDGPKCSGAGIALAANASGCGLLTYSWDFGDGTPVSTMANPVHAYAAGGTYSACVTVTGAGGCSSPVRCTSVLVHSRPTAAPAASPPACAGIGVEFTGNPSGGTAPYSFSWSFGDGSPPDPAENPNHVFASPGNYLVALVVQDSNGCTSGPKSLLVFVQSCIGEVPDGDDAPGAPLRLEKAGSDVVLRYAPAAGATHYNTYRGTLASLALGSFDHSVRTTVDLCPGDGSGDFVDVDFAALFDPTGTYYVVAGNAGVCEGPVGFASDRTMEPHSSANCSLPGCP